MPMTTSSSTRVKAVALLLVAAGISMNRSPACAPVPSHANSATSSKLVSQAGSENARFQRPAGRLPRGNLIAIPPSLRSKVETFKSTPVVGFDNVTGIRMGILELRLRSRFIKARAARKLDLARSVETGL